MQKWIVLAGGAALAVPVLAIALVLGMRGSVLSDEARADKVVVEKAARRLTLYAEGHVLKQYRVALGRAPVGAKQQQGDARTPEGQFVIDYRNSGSRYHLSLHVSYPRPSDVRRARAQDVKPGGDIMIHGLPNALGWLEDGRHRSWKRLAHLHCFVDWTQGCIALTNTEIEELWRAVPDGTPIEIRP